MVQSIPEKNPSSAIPLDELLVEEILFFVKVGMGLLTPSYTDGSLQLYFEHQQIRYTLTVKNCRIFQAAAGQDTFIAACCGGRCTAEEWFQFRALLPIQVTHTSPGQDLLQVDYSLPIPSGSELSYQAAVLERLKVRHPHLKGPHFSRSPTRALH